MIKAELISKYYVVSDEKYKIRCTVINNKQFVITGFNDRPFKFDNSSLETVARIGELIQFCSTLIEDNQ